MSQANPQPPDTVVRPLAIDLSVTLASKLLLIGSSVGSTIIISRLLGPSGRGGFAVAVAFVTLLVQFGLLGLDSATTYFAARDPERAPQIVANGIWTVLTGGGLLMASGVALGAVAPSLLRGLDSVDVTILILTVPAALGVKLLQGLLLGEGRILAYNGVESITALSLCALIAVCLVAFHLGLKSAVIAYATTTVAACAACGPAIARRRPIPKRLDRTLGAQMVKYGGRLYIAALVAYLVARLNLLLVNAYLGPTRTGQYAVVVGLSDVIHQLPTVVALNLFPRVVRGDSATDTARIFRSVSLLYGLVCVATVPVARFVIVSLYGHRFEPAVAVYYWSVPAVYAYGMVSVLSYHFAGHGFPMGALLVWCVGLAVDLVVAIPFLTTHSSLDYVGLATSTAYVVMLALLMRMYARERRSYRPLIPSPREAFALFALMLKWTRDRVSGS